METIRLNEDDFKKYGQRKLIFDELTALGQPVDVYEFMGMGSPEQHYRHFLVMTENDMSEDIEPIFKKHITKRTDIHFATTLYFDMGPLVNWFSITNSAMLL